jgi:hypothetical protein
MDELAVAVRAGGAEDEGHRVQAAIIEAPA